MAYGSHGGGAVSYAQGTPAHCSRSQVGRDALPTRHTNREETRTAPFQRVSNGIVKTPTLSRYRRRQICCFTVYFTDTPFSLHWTTYAAQPLVFNPPLRSISPLWSKQRESSLLTSYWSESSLYSWWTGLAPWEFELPFPGSLTSTSLVRARIWPGPRSA